MAPVSCSLLHVFEEEQRNPVSAVEGPARFIQVNMSGPRHNVFYTCCSDCHGITAYHPVCETLSKGPEPICVNPFSADGAGSAPQRDIRDRPRKCGEGAKVIRWNLFESWETSPKSPIWRVHGPRL